MLRIDLVSDDKKVEISQVLNISLLKDKLAKADSETNVCQGGVILKWNKVHSLQMSLCLLY